MDFPSARDRPCPRAAPPLGGLAGPLSGAGFRGRRLLGRSRQRPAVRRRLARPRRANAGRHRPLAARVGGGRGLCRGPGRAGRVSAARPRLRRPGQSRSSSPTRPTAAMSASWRAFGCCRSWPPRRASARSSRVRTPTTWPTTAPAAGPCAETGAVSPLVELGFGKSEIRALAQAMGLGVWDRPSAPCLATRFPYGSPVTRDGLAPGGRRGAIPARARLSGRSGSAITARSLGSKSPPRRSNGWPPCASPFRL